MMTEIFSGQLTITYKNSNKNNIDLIFFMKMPKKNLKD